MCEMKLLQEDLSAEMYEGGNKTYNKQFTLNRHYTLVHTWHSQ